MKRIMSKYHIAVQVLTLLFAFKESTAQSEIQAAAKTIGSVSISSPTAASLGKFGDIPVNYFTGIP
ncbi:MAG TPA: hypothetical protein VHC50_12530, partial [Puia sp.]|nr:hypothetical protein [Puia sp.]